MKNRIILALLLLPMTVWATDIVTLQSPNQQVKGRLLQQSGSTYLDVLGAADKRLARIRLGLSTATEDYQNLQVTKVGECNDIEVEYTLSHGKCSNPSNRGRGLRVQMQNEHQQPLTLEVCTYDDGVAFRYLLPDNGSERTFTDEATTITIDTKAHRWLQPFTTSYEADYPYQSKGGKQGDWGFPCLFEQAGTFMLVTEADANRMYCSTHLSNQADAASYKVSYPFEWEGNRVGDVQPTWQGEWTSPWRVCIIGTLADVFASTLVEDVSTPTQMTDLSWVRPGGSAWVYWAHNHGTRDYRICRQYVDLAAAMGWPYVLFDWEWDSMYGGGTIEDACHYALSRGVKPLMWYNSGGPHNGVGSTPRDRMLTHESRMAEFKWLRAMGVAGVKIDFFESDKQHMMNYYIDILEDAAQAHIMVNFHGATIPRGWTRTWPHLMSTEGVFGAEQYNNSPRMTDNAPHINCVLPFTRNVVGPMDYTPVAFTHSQHPHTTSYAHELALAVVFESAIQHWADRPEGFLGLPEGPRQFMSQVPTAWDESRLLQGYPAEFAVVARRRGQDWYVGGLEGLSRERTFRVEFNFLDEGAEYMLQLHADGRTGTEFSTTIRKVCKGDCIEVPCLARGGFAMQLRRS